MRRICLWMAALWCGGESCDADQRDSYIKFKWHTLNLSLSQTVPGTRLVRVCARCEKTPNQVIFYQKKKDCFSSNVVYTFEHSYSTWLCLLFVQMNAAYILIHNLNQIVAIKWVCFPLSLSLFLVLLSNCGFSLGLFRTDTEWSAVIKVIVDTFKWLD